MCRWRTSASSLESWKREISQLGDGRSLGEWRQRRPCRKARVGSLNETFGGERERGFQGKKHNNNNNNITHRKRESWGKKTQEEEDWITNQPGFVWHSLRLFAVYKRTRVSLLFECSLSESNKSLLSRPPAPLITPVSAVSSIPLDPLARLQIKTELQSPSARIVNSSGVHWK